MQFFLLSCFMKLQALDRALIYTGIKRKMEGESKEGNSLAAVMPERKLYLML
jgi:hypothetical protein